MITIFHCSNLEIETIDRVLRAAGEDGVIRKLDAPDAEAAHSDYAIVGTSPCRSRERSMALIEALEDVPIVFLTTGPEDDALIPDDACTLGVSELQRLPQVIQRERRLRRAEAAARDSESRYRTLISNIPDVTWQADARLHMLFVSANAEALWGYTEDEVMRGGLEWKIRSLHPADVEKVLAASQALVESGTGYDLEFRFRHRAGHWIWMHERAVSANGEGGVREVFGVVYDVTSRKKEHEARIAAERTFRALVEQSLVGVYVVFDGRVRYANRKAAEIFGYQNVPVEKMPDILSLMASDEQRLVFEHMRLQLTTGEGSVDYIARCRRQDGELIDVELFASAIEIDGQRAIVGTCLDVTDRRRAEDALRKSEELYRMLVEQANDIIFSIDVEGRITSLNRAFETLTGWSGAHWIGRPFLDLVDPTSLDGGLAVFLGNEPNRVECRLVTRFGSHITIEATAQTLTLDGETIGTLGIARDVTKRKESELQLEKEKRLASLGHLSASVAHEFNNVLMSIMPFAELLKRRVPNDPGVETATRHIFQAIKRGRQISQEILRFARPASPTLVPIDLRAWLDEFESEAEALLGPKFRARAIFMPEDAVFVRGDRALLDQVATNLVANARDAMPNGGTVVIDIHRAENRQVEISVHDSGHGIPEEIIDRVFDPLFTTKPAGHGLGLSVAHQAMTQQNGLLRVRSGVGAGSTFSMVFPECSPETGEEVVLIEAPPIVLRKRVLLVEDDESVGEGIRALLIDEGFEVKLVVRGREAPRAIEEFQPDLMLLDVNLPDVSGIDVYHAVQSRWPDLPVIFSTGHADTGAIGLGSREVPSIMKPYDIAELLTVMAKAERVLA